MNIILPDEIIKGDYFSLEGTLDVTITDWKIRCQIQDDGGSCIKLATENTGGADNQIEITDGTNGVFIIQIANDLTANFCGSKGHIEIEVETNDTPTKKFTIHQGEIEFLEQKIDWITP